MKKELEQAKVRLLFKKAVFLATIVLSIKHNFSEDIPTACTDGTSITYNPHYFAKQSKNGKVGLIAHEAWHIGLSHNTRKGKRDHKLFNWAADIVIDTMLLNQGYEVPDSLADQKYVDWSTEQVYNDIINKEKKPPPNYQPDLQFIKAPPGLDPSAKVKVIKDATEALNTEIKTIVAKASLHSKLQNEKAGNVPGELVRVIDDLLNPKLHWETILHRYLTEQIKNNYTWAKPNKRFLPNFYLPSLYSEGLVDLVIAIDTSGSINNQQLKEILTEIQYIYDTYKPQKLTILDCDHRIHNIHEVGSDTFIGNIIDLKFSGGGGTSFHPVIKYCNDNNPSLLLYFTDLYAEEIKKEQDYPIMWLCYSNHNPAPIGTTIYYDPKNQ